MSAVNLPSVRRRASLREVAAASGTSVATASRVLNNTGYIAEATRARVMKAAAELNYQPNLRAKGLRQQSSRTVGLLIPNLLNAYYTALADQISQLLSVAGYQLLLSSTRDDPAIEKEALGQLIGHDVDGLIWVPTAADSALLDSLASQHIPAISVVRRVESDRVDTVVFEDLAGAQAAVGHLVGLGHRRIAIIGGDIQYSSNAERLQGYTSALQAAGLARDPGLIQIGVLREAWGASAMQALLARPDPPSAVFIASNALMPGVMRTLRASCRVQVPRDLSLICFDDLDWFSFSEPAISAVSTSHVKIAEAAVRLLLERVNHPAEIEKPPAFLKISFDLVLRGSTARPAG